MVNKLVNYQTVALLAVLAAITPFGHSATPNDKLPGYVATGVPVVSILFKGKGVTNTLENEGLSRSLAKNVLDLFEAPWFKGRLPNSLGVIGVIVDGDWTMTEGYSSTDLKTQDGAPAILLQRDAILNDGAQKRLLVHELTHLMHRKYRPLEEPWVKEGVALLGEYIVTKSFNPSFKDGFLSPETSLIKDFDHNEHTLPQYGHVLQYFYFIYQKCGKVELANNLLTSSSKKVGTYFMDELLAPDCGSFEKSFVEFEKERFFPEPYPVAGFMGLSNLKAVVRISEPHTPLPPYSARAYRISDPDVHCEHGTTQFAPHTCFEVRLRDRFVGE